MTPREAVIELERAIGQAIVQYEKAVPSGICIGIFIGRQADGFKVKPRLKTRQNPPGGPPTQTQQHTSIQKLIFWLILVPLFAWCGRDGLRGQTLVNAPQVPWQQVNFSACGGSPRVGTLLNIAQIRQPQPSPLQARPAKNPLERPMSGPFSGPKRRPMALMQITPGCWPSDLQDNAWSIITTKCTRCHGVDGPWLDSSGVWHPFPPDSLLGFQNTKAEVGNLDLRTFQSMRTGGNRGPAVVPGDSSRSLIYRFTSLLISVPPTDADVQALDALDALFPRMAVLMPPYPMGLQPAEIAALKDWIEARCPMVR